MILWIQSNELEQLLSAYPLLNKLYIFLLSSPIKPLLLTFRHSHNQQHPTQMSHKKQTHQRVTTSKNKVVYFKKQFKLMIHNITLEQEIRSTVFSLQTANYTSIPHAVFHITINSTVDITTIDMTSNQQEKADLEVTLDLSHFAKGIKNDLAIVKFQVAREKILAPSSVNFYTQPLANRKGTIEYKFVSQKVTEIDDEEFARHNVRRDEIIQIEKELAENPELKRLVEILDAKDEVIKTLEKKIASLIEETRKLTHNLQRETSEQRKRLRQGLNLNLNVNASNNYHMKRLNEKLTEQNGYLQKRLQTVEQQLESTEKQLIEYRCENNILQIQIGKKSIIDGPTINLNPSKSIIEHNRHMLHKINEQEYDEELEKKSKMADSFFLQGDQSSVRSKVYTGRRANHAVTVNPGLTPRSNSKGRTKSAADNNLVSNLQQQLHQSKVMDQDQIQFELNELKDLRQNMQNKLLQAVPQQDGMIRYPRLQAAIKSSYRVMQRLNEQKNLLQEKLKRREQQIEYLRRQLDKSKQNFKNFEKQLRQRSSNAKDQFEQRMAGIKLQTEMKMAEMRRQNRFSDYESVMQTQKRQIEIQKMRYENDALREKYEEAMNELRNLQLEKASEQNKYRTVEAAINKEKDLYKSKYYEMQESFTKQEEELEVTKDKAKVYELHLARIDELEKIEHSLKDKLEREEKLAHELKNKIKRYEDKFTQIQPKWEYYRQMQHEFDLLKKKNDTITKLNDRFQSRMEQLKKFASRLENAYYERKQKNQSDNEFQEHYKKQLEERLELTFRKLRTYQREFYEEQMKELTDSKKELIEFYYKRIVEQSHRIDENPTYTEADKQKFKNQKERQINILKEAKIDQLDRQFKKYQTAFAKLVSTEEYLPKGLNQKVSYLQEKMRKFEVGQFGTGVLSNASQSILKNTVDRLNDSIKDRQSQITELKRTIGKMSDGSSLLKVNNVQIANQRKSMIEEMQKSREIFTRSLEDLKKANQELLKQKSQLQIEVQNYRFRQEKLIFKNTEHQKDLERVSRKNTEQFQKKIKELQKTLQKKNDENLKNKILKEQFEQHTKQLLSEVNSNASLLEKLSIDLKNIEEQNEQLKSRLELYHEAQKILLHEVDNIKQQADFDMKAFKALLEERNQEFERIKHIKDVEIQKLNKTIQQYEYKIQTEVNQYLHTRRDLENLQEKYGELESQLQETKMSFNMVNQNYNKVEEDSVLKIHELEEANVMLENNLMQMAETLKEKEMQLQECKIKQQSLQKQFQAISTIKQELTQQQAQFLTKQNHYEQLIEELTDKLASLEKKYIEISDKVHEVQRENSFVNCKLIEKDSEVQELRDKLNKKYDEINQVKGLKFDMEMKVKQMSVEIEGYEKARENDRQRMSEFEGEVGDLRRQVESLENELQQQQMQKSRLKPPPRTGMMPGSSLSDNELGVTRMNRSVRPMDSSNNDIQRNQVRQSEQSQQTRIQIQQAQSIRGSHQATPNDLNFQASGPNRFRIFTVNQAQEDMRTPTNRHENGKNSIINMDISINSDEDANLDSDKSVRERDVFKNQNVFKTMVRRQDQPAEQSIVIDQNVYQAQSYGSSQLVQQYIKEIQTLKQENNQLIDDKMYLQQENTLLKDKIAELTGNVQQTQNKNLLASALGLTGGLFFRQDGQRSSVQSNHENPNIPKLKIKTGSNIAPSISSKEAIRIEDGKSFRGSIAVSRKSSIISPNRSPKMSPRERQNQRKQGASLARSSVGDIISTRKQSLQQHVEQQNERVRELQLMLHEVQEENKQLKEALDDEHQANERLMQELVVIQQAEEDKHRLFEEKARQVEELTEYYEGIRNEMERRVEKLVQQGMEREGEELKLLKTFQTKNEQMESLVNKIETLQRQISQKSAQIAKLSQQKERSYKQFRKYEQESQLQILKLKQQMTHLTELTHKKHTEVQLLAQDYFEINNELNQLKQTLNDKQIQINHKNTQIEQITKTHHQTLEQSKKTQENKRTLRQRIHELQNDLVSYQTNMMDVNKATSLIIKKYQIKLNTSQQEKNALKDKIQQRQTTLQSLKHTIALYNDETDQLKQLNKELTLELERTEAQLKDIMKSYQNQFAELNLNLIASNQNLAKVKALVSEKDEQIHKLTKIITSLEFDTRAAFNSEIQVKQAFQKYKNAKQNQIAHLSAQVQLKNDEYQKIKTQYDKQSQEFKVKEQEYSKRLTQSEQGKKTYKQKLVKYQSVLQQLQKELQVMSQRPSKEQFDEVEFENELYKNRIEQLEQMLREFVPQTAGQGKHGSKLEEALQMEFKRYKVQKERELDDLSSEIEKYCLKINELQEGNFLLKKQIQKLRQQITVLLQQNEVLQEQNYDLKEDLTEMKEEIEFYKGKRIENLSKLLNETM